MEWAVTWLRLGQSEASYSTLFIPSLSLPLFFPSRAYEGAILLLSVRITITFMYGGAIIQNVGPSEGELLEVMFYVFCRAVRAEGFVSGSFRLSVSRVYRINILGRDVTRCNFIEMSREQ